MGELVRMISESPDTDRIGFSRDDNHLFFDMGKRLLISRMLTGQFPNYEAVLPRNNDRIVTVDRDEIAAAIKRVAILSDERSRTVKMALGNGSLEITASHSDLGEATKPWKSITTKKIFRSVSIINICWIPHHGRRTGSQF